MQETRVQSLGREDALEEETATVLQKRGCIFAGRVNECLNSSVHFDNFQLKAVCCAVDTKLDFPQSISFEW